MKGSTLDNLITKYRQKADFHGAKAILGNPKYRKYHQLQEKIYDRLIVKIGEKYLKEVKYG
jgi:hypothetical protein